MVCTASSYWFFQFFHLSSLFVNIYMYSYGNQTLPVLYQFYTIRLCLLWAMILMCVCFLFRAWLVVLSRSTSRSIGCHEHGWIKLQHVPSPPNIDALNQPQPRGAILLSNMFMIWHPVNEIWTITNANDYSFIISYE